MAGERTDAAATADPAVVAAHAAQLKKYGFTVLPGIIPAHLVAGVRANCLRASSDIRLAQAAGEAAAKARAGTESGTHPDHRRLAAEALASRRLLPPRDRHPPPPACVEDHNAQLNAAAAELLEAHGVSDLYDETVPTGSTRHWHDCHFADAPSQSPLKHVLQGQGEVQQNDRTLAGGGQAASTQASTTWRTSPGSAATWRTR